MHACMWRRLRKVQLLVGGPRRNHQDTEVKINVINVHAVCLHVCVPTSLHTRWCQSDPPALKRPTRSPTSRPCEHTSTTTVTRPEGGGGDGHAAEAICDVREKKNTACACNKSLQDNIGLDV